MDSGEIKTNQAPTYYAKKKENERHAASRHDIIFAAFLAVFSILITDFVLWCNVGLGTSISACVILAATFIYLYKTRRHFSVYTVSAAATYVILSISLTFSDNAFSKFLAVCIMAVLYCVTVMDMTDARSRRPGSFRAISDLCRTAIIQPLDNIYPSMWAIFHRKGDDGKVSPRKTGGIFIGIMCSVPALCIIIPLLISSDEAFQSLMSKLNFDMSMEIIFSIIFGLILFVLLFAQAFSLKHGKAEKAEAKAFGGIADPASVCAFMCVVSIVYLLYLFSQLAYFFNAFSGILNSGFTMAQYARRGFFEMCVVCFINLIIVFLCNILSRKKNGKSSPAVKYPSLFICLFSLLLIATAISKMGMYINNFGMTHLRIFTSMFMILLAVVFISVILRLFIKNVPYMQISLIAAALILAVLQFADIDRVVTSYNINAYLDGRLSTIDFSTLENLESDAVVPYLFELLDSENAEVRGKAEALLHKHLYMHFDVVKDENGEKQLAVKHGGEVDFRSYNIHTYRAVKMLRENWRVFYDFDKVHPSDIR